MMCLLPASKKYGRGRCTAVPSPSSSIECTSSQQVRNMAVAMAIVACLLLRTDASEAFSLSMHPCSAVSCIVTTRRGWLASSKTMRATAHDMMSSDDGDGDENTGGISDARRSSNVEQALKQAEKLRTRARELLAEAEEAESKMRNEAQRRKRRRDSGLDALIDELVVCVSTVGTNHTCTDQNGKRVSRFIAKPALSGVLSHKSSSSDGEGEELIEGQRIEVLAAKLRTLPEPLTTTVLLRVVERIHEREKESREIDLIENSSNSLEANGKHEDRKRITTNSAAILFSGLSHALVEAVALIEGEEAKKDSSKQVQSNHSMQPNDDNDDSIPTSKIPYRSSPKSDTGNNLSHRRRHGTLTDNAAPRLRARMNELRRADEAIFKRNLASIPMRINQQLQRDANATNVVVQGKSQNASDFLENFLDSPSWLPNSLAPFIQLQGERLDKNQTKQLREEVLAGSDFFCTGWETTKQCALFHGNFVQKRGSSNTAQVSYDAKAESSKILELLKRWVDSTKNSIQKDKEHDEISSKAFINVQERLKDLIGLGDRIQLFLLEDTDEEFQGAEGMNEHRPALLAIPASVKPHTGKNRTRFMLALATLYTTVNYAISAYSLSMGGFFACLTRANRPKVMKPCISFVGGMFSLLLTYEFSRAIVAKRNKMSIGTPIPLPSLHFGLIGSQTSLRSFPETRRALFDVAVSGPVFTMISSLILISCGLFATTGALPEELARMPVVPAGVVSKTSFLIGLLVLKVCPKLHMLPLSQPVPVHSTVLLGMAGLILSGINLLPIGRLDGGRLFLAAFGRRKAHLVSFLTLLILMVSAVSGSSTVSLFCAFLILVHSRKAEIPAKNEVTGVGLERLWAVPLILTITGLVLAPFPGGFGAL